MKCTRPITVALAAALALVAAPGLAGELATMSVHPGGLSWAPTVEYDHAVVTVSGEGHYLRYQVSAAEALSFDAFDEQGQALPDGQYTYEIVLAPKVDPQLRARQAAMAERRTERAPQILSGSFQIVAGAVVAGGEEEPSPAAPTGGNRLALRDQVIPDDLIVQGSACIGIDCVNNENFGFDTIRMKENNTRIDFTDTSSTAGFPTQDWEIAANDSASGGRNALIFSDENTQLFVIEAGNLANAIYVDDLAKVGFRTSNPVLDLHVSTGNTPGLRLEQTSGSGFTAQTWDIAGNEANFFVRDVTGGSLLPFRIRPGAPTSSIDIAATGNVGLGTTSPDVKLDVESAGDTEFRLTKTVGGVAETTFRTTATTNAAFFGTSTNDVMAFVVNSLERMRINTVGRVSIGCADPSTDFVVQSVTDGVATCATAPFSALTAGSTSFTASSSRTIKENIVPVPSQGVLDKIAAVDVFNYDFINGPKNRLGLMAEDFNGTFGRGTSEMLDGQDVQMALWLAVQELAQRTAELEATEATLEQLRRDNGGLAERLERLEAALVSRDRE